jgi:hypothetical protein
MITLAFSNFHAPLDMSQYLRKLHGHSRGSGGGRAEGRYLRLILPFAVSIPESTLMPFSVGGGSRLSGPLGRLTGASLGYFPTSWS